jgi:prefoldin subunit 5
MAQTLEKRVEELERQFTELRAQVLDLTQRKKDWRSTVGTLEDDEVTREAERLGREYRKQQTYENEIAGS